eukprot:TRINITY_DN3304_c0_g1_i1.p1 TRINITY_DN3304_c0_g1~~TRINITY_DN3304_c0_g1_i1.p1  ORF type:complete len:193 (-),score=23.54 TRINITY_DN3304_c0_g1_i1:281-814(-)
MLGQPSSAKGAVPYLLASGLTPEQAQTDEETWSLALQEVGLDTGPDPQEFLQAALPFCNDKLFGTLSCGVSVHPSLMKEHQSVILQALSDLKYGAIAVNSPPTMGFLPIRTPWGAWNAAGTPENIGSGNVLSQTANFDNAEKGIVWYPFQPPGKGLGKLGDPDSSQIGQLLKMSTSW